MSSQQQFKLNANGALSSVCTCHHCQLIECNLWRAEMTLQQHDWTTVLRCQWGARGGEGRAVIHKMSRLSNSLAETQLQEGRLTQTDTNSTKKRRKTRSGRRTKTVQAQNEPFHRQLA